MYLGNAIIHVKQRKTSKTRSPIEEFGAIFILARFFMKKLILIGRRLIQIQIDFDRHKIHFLEDLCFQISTRIKNEENHCALVTLNASIVVY